MRVLVPVTGAFHGRLRVRRSTGELDTEGLERVLSPESVKALSLAKQLDATLVAVHVDKGAGEEILREALAYGVQQGILIEGAPAEATDAASRAATIADVYRQNGPFDVVIGPAQSEFAGFTGTLAAVAGQLDLPCVHGVRSIRREGEGFRVGYASLFGDYELQVPAHTVVLAGEVPLRYPTAWDIAHAHGEAGVLRVRADAYEAARPRSKRVRIEAIRPDTRPTEEVDGATLVRRLRARSLIPEGGGP